MHLGMSDELLQTKNGEIFETTAQILRHGDDMVSTYAAAVDVAKQRIAGAQETGIHAS
jgi:hypothetical protein